MNLSITPELQQLIQRKIDSGMYTNASEVVRDALRRMDAGNEWQSLRDLLLPRIAAADRAAERGELLTADDAFTLVKSSKHAPK